MNSYRNEARVNSNDKHFTALTLELEELQRLSAYVILYMLVYT